jgi:hypothetical protein
VFGKGVDSLTDDRNIRVLLNRLCDLGCEAVAIDCECRAGGNAVLVAYADN